MKAEINIATVNAMQEPKIGVSSLNNFLHIKNVMQQVIEQTSAKINRSIVIDKTPN